MCEGILMRDKEMAEELKRKERVRRDANKLLTKVCQSSKVRKEKIIDAVKSLLV